ncbi:jumonji domain containing 5 [Cordyceps militaris]|uniref:Jumonji domain containing 5 n=1 Tax=Cordyceps militaris TaxID=73501 RepID=A0A2H4SLE8_CORMI|nr:jumonji domain containing 5 [Cordyceps militaris]
MSPAPFMWPELRKLLDRFCDGTTKVADATNEEPALPNPQPLPFTTTRAMDALDRGAMTSLLNTQAHRLLNLHEVTTTGTGLLNPACEQIPRRLKDLELASHSRIYAYRFDQVPSFWGQIYSDVQVLSAFHFLLEQLKRQSPPEQFQAFLKALDEVVACLDRSLIITGGCGILKNTWIEGTFKIISAAWKPYAVYGPDVEFSTKEPYGRPPVTSPCTRRQGWTMDKFERYMTIGHSLTVETGQIGIQPIVFTDLTKHTWPAIVERRWFRPNYLLSHTVGGRRLVPVEIGLSYVHSDWGQQLLSFKNFLVGYIDNRLTVDHAVCDTAEPIPMLSRVPGYLAQHDLFRQIPALRNDILVPDFCWATVPGHPLNEDKVRPKLEVPALNVWFGSAGTTTPLHTDSYTNLLCQVVGTKYVRLYPPQADKYMRPFKNNPEGADMSNTSTIDLGAVYGWDKCTTDDMSSDGEAAELIEQIKNELSTVEYFDCILEPGDTLLIPIGWWHHVRSLSVSFSVSFWWN